MLEKREVLSNVKLLSLMSKQMQEKQLFHAFILIQIVAFVGED
jgi:hypothetical protein